MRKLLVQGFRYGVVSALALALDTLILWILVKRLHWNTLPASMVAFAAGATLAYGLSVSFVFPVRTVPNRGLEFASFVALGLAGVLVNAVSLELAIGAIGLGLIAAKVLAAGCTFATNFTLRRQLLFAPSERP